MSKSFKDVPLPVWMKNLPLDKRGYPIPYTVLVEEGKPYFTINDESLRQEVIKKGCCPICNRKLLRWRALVGGPMSAFHPHGAFIDPPMHIECATYALQVCPYLAVPSYRKSIAEAQANEAAPKVQATLIDNTMTPGRPEVFVLVVHDNARYVYFDDPVLGTPTHFVRYIRPKRPYVRVEYWQFGKKLTDKEGSELIKPMLVEQLMNDLAAE